MRPSGSPAGRLTPLACSKAEQVLSSPKAWVLRHIEQVAEDAIDWDDYGDYRRLLELYALLDPHLLPCAIERGLTSDDPDVREAAEDFRDPASIESIRTNFTRSLTEVYPESADSSNVEATDSTALLARSGAKSDPLMRLDARPLARQERATGDPVITVSSLSAGRAAGSWQLAMGRWG